MRIICIGDSLTYGYRVDEEKKWTYLISREPGIELINKGVLGDSTSGIIMRFFSEVVILKPDAVFIMGGSNDFLMNRSLESVQNNIKQLIKEAKQFNIKVLLGVQPPMISHLAKELWDSTVNFEDINKKINIYGEWVKNYSIEQSFSYIDFFNKFINNISTNHLSEYYLDGIHLNIAGHKFMYKCAIDVFKCFNYF